MNDGDELPGPELEEPAHHLLLILAGRIPDAELAGCRQALYRGDVGELAGRLVRVLGGSTVATSDQEYLVLGVLLAGAVEAGLVDVADLAGIEEAPTLPDGTDPPMAFDFVADPLGDQAAIGADLTGLDPADLDPVERAAVAAVAQLPDAVGLWRAWRRVHPARSRIGPPVEFAPVTRVFVLELAASRPAAAAGRLQAALLAAGEPVPLVETCRSDVPLPPYQQAARSAGALLWARTPASELTLLPVGSDDLEPLDPAAGRQLAAYLTRAPLLWPGPTAHDRLRTDGRYIWSDLPARQAVERGFVPAAELVTAATTAAAAAFDEPQLPFDESVLVFRALDHLLASWQRAPIEVIGTGGAVLDGWSDPAAGSVGLDAPGARYHWHQLIMRLAGRVPDPQLAEARDLLDQGRILDLARWVVRLLAEAQQWVASADAALLAEVLDRAGDREPVVELAAARARAAGRVEPAHRFDPPPPVDDLDRALVEAAGAEPGAVGVWCATRAGADDIPAAGVRVYLVQLDPEQVDTDRLPAVTGRLQRLAGLLHDGLLHEGTGPVPTVEVFAHLADLPTYQARAWLAAAPRWPDLPADADAPADAEVRVAQVFDQFGPDRGAGFGADRVVMPDDADAAWVLDYLEGAPALPVPDDPLPDVLDPDRGEVVPTGARTDGEWIWSAATAYYLREHRAAPDEGLVAHIRARGYLLPQVTALAVHRAMVRLAG